MSVGIGILGFAHGHVGMYCGQWRKWPDEASLIAGWDHDPARLKENASKWNIEAVDDARVLVDRREIDAVVIGAETSMHAELVELAAAAGKAIILQKPISLSLDDADRIVQAVRTHRVAFTMAWQMRVDPQNMAMKQLIESGQLGRMYMVRRRHGLPTHLWENFDRSWHANPELNRGMWADDASHAVDFLLWLLGKPVSVIADIDTLNNPGIPDDQGIAVFRYPDGTFAEVMSSFTCCAGENTTEIICDKGVVIQNFGDLPSCNAPRPEGGVGLKWYLHEQGRWFESEIASPANHGERITGLARPLLDFLKAERGPIATAEEGRVALQMILASHESAAAGRRVKL